MKNKSKFSVLLTASCLSVLIHYNYALTYHINNNVLPIAEAQLIPRNPGIHRHQRSPDESPLMKKSMDGTPKSNNPKVLADKVQDQRLITLFEQLAESLKSNYLHRISSFKIENKPDPEFLSLVLSEFQRLPNFITQLKNTNSIKTESTLDFAKAYLKTTLENIQNLSPSSVSNDVRTNILNYGNDTDFLDSLILTNNSHSLILAQNIVLLNTPLVNFWDSAITTFSTILEQLDSQISSIILLEINGALEKYFNAQLTKLTHNGNNSDELKRLLDPLDDIQKMQSQVTTVEYFSNFMNILKKLDSSLVNSNQKKYLEISALLFDMEHQLSSYGANKTINSLLIIKQRTNRQISWSTKIQSFLPQIKINLNKLLSETESRITTGIKNFSNKLELEITKKFDIDRENPLTRNWKDDISDLVDDFNKIFTNQPMSDSTSTSESLFRLASQLTQIITVYNSTIFEEFTQNLIAAGGHFDRLRQVSSFTSTGTQQRTAGISLEWMSPLKTLLESLKATLIETDLNGNSTNACSYETIVINGKNYKIAVAQGAFLSLKNVVDGCSLLQNGAQGLLLSSYHTVYIDTNLNAESTQDIQLLAIVAPNWVIQGNRGIFLQGSDGMNQTKSPGQNRDGEGLPGDPGQSGASGGNFLGIGQNVFGGNLHVISAGGRGGNGQDGGNGKDGTNGEEVDLNKISYEWHKASNADSVSIDKIIPGPYDYDNENWEWSCHYRLGTFDCRDYWFKGHMGTKGKNGGDGGKGGAGGLGGLVTFIFDFTSQQQQKSFLTFEQKNAPAGQDGSDGAGGKGGTNGKKVKVRFNPQKNGHLENHTNGMKILGYKADSVSKMAQGNNGTKGKNLKNAKATTTFFVNSIFTLPDQLEVLNLYRKLAIAERSDKPTDPFTKPTLQRFLLFLNNNKMIREATPISH